MSRNFGKRAAEIRDLASDPRYHMALSDREVAE